MSTAARTLMLGWEYPPEITGGLGTACRGIVTAMAAGGADLIFVAPQINEALSSQSVRFVSTDRMTAPRAPAFASPLVRTLSVDSPLTPYMTQPSYARVLEELRTMSSRAGSDSVLSHSADYGPDLVTEVKRYASAVQSLAAEEDLRLVHAHDWMTFPAALQIRDSCNVPLVVHVHSLEIDRNAREPDPAITRIENATFEAADHIIAVSFYTKGRLVERYGVPEWKITVVHNAVSGSDAPWPKRVRKPFDRKLVLFLGRVTSQKGPEYFLDAAARVIEKDESIWFVMAGSGDMLPEMIELAAELRISSNFHFTGFLRGPDVERMYAMSDLYVMPSVSEPFGIAGLEAILYDIPVIVSRQSGVAEVLTHALKVDFWDVEELAGSILAALNCPVLRDYLIRNSSEMIADLCWENAAERINEVHRMVLGSA